MQSRSFNQLILMTDEHTRKVLGCYGNKIVKTPHIDRLAREGTLFENAYTNVPICASELPLQQEIMHIAPAIGIMPHPILAHLPLGAVHCKTLALQ